MLPALALTGSSPPRRFSPTARSWKNTSLGGESSSIFRSIWGGTDFEKRCWQALLDIPYGETRSYADIARAIGSPKACRAVGLANRNNPVAIIVPCHRVIGANGALTGYGGGLQIKRKLLELEASQLPLLC